MERLNEISTSALLSNLFSGHIQMIFFPADALDNLLTQLQEKGYQLVPISELIYREKYHLDVTGKQIAE